MNYIDIRVIALTEEDVINFLDLCKVIQDAGDRGAGKIITVHCDGDGSGVPSFMVKQGEEFEKLVPGEGARYVNAIYLGE